MKIKITEVHNEDAWFDKAHELIGDIGEFIHGMPINHIPDGFVNGSYLSDTNNDLDTYFFAIKYEEVL